MKKIKVMIGLAVMMLMVAACSENSNSDGDIETVDRLFQRIKASYKGNYMATNNTMHPLNFTIDNQANVVVDQFPMNLILAKLYPDEYSMIIPTATSTALKAPIKGFNLDSTLNFIEFSTDVDQTELVDFTFTKDEEEHTGWAQVHVVGVYNIYTSTMTIQFSVTDLVIDNQDMQSMTPIHYFVDSALKE